MATLGQLMARGAARGATEIYGKTRPLDSRPHGPGRLLAPEDQPAPQELTPAEKYELQDYLDAQINAGNTGRYRPSLANALAVGREGTEGDITFTALSSDQATGALLTNTFGPLDGSGGFFSAARIAEYPDTLGRLAGNLPPDLAKPHPLQDVYGQRNFTGVAPPDEHPLTTVTRDILVNTNRFSPSSESPYVKDGKLTARGTYYYPRGQFGRYSDMDTSGTENRVRNPDSWDDWIGSDAVWSSAKIIGGDGAITPIPYGGRVLTVLDMRTRAMRSLVEATGPLHGPGIDAEETAYNHPNVDSALMADLFALIPGETQMGFGKVPIGNMFIPDADYFGLSGADAEYDSGGVKDDNYADSFSKRSYGQLNSPYEPFGGALPMGMVFPAIYGAIAVILVALMIKMIMGLMDSLGAADEASDYGIDPHAPWLHAKGSYRNPVNKPGWLMRQVLTAMGWPSHLKYDFSKNVQRGIKVFYGMKPEDDGIAPDNFDELLDMMAALVESPGFYTIIIKRVVADTEQIGDAFANFSPSPLGAITSIMEILQTIGASTTFRFLVRMSELGEQMAIFMYENGVNNGPGASATENDPISAQNRLLLTRFESGGVRKSPTSLSAYRSLFLAGQPMWDPGKTVSLDDAYKLGNSLTEVVSVGPSTQGGIINRLTPHLISEFENKIHADYMPFTIQDLRNNEIMSLPAFLEGIDDSFSVDYNTTDSYGRTDPVRTWSKTTRTVGINFKMVAHSESDHDYMYFLINKLTSMIYPQRSSGRTMFAGKDGKNRYNSPFSQVPIGTPVVRLRLGELIHSNYSLTSFAKLLGHPGSFNMNQGEGNDSAVHNKATAIAIRTARSTFERNVIFGDKWMASLSAKATGGTHDPRDAKDLSRDKVAIIPKGSKVFLIESPPTPPSPLELAAGALGVGKEDIEVAPLLITTPTDIKAKIAGSHFNMRYDGESLPAAAYAELNDEEKKKIKGERYMIFEPTAFNADGLSKEQEATIKSTYGNLVLWFMKRLQKEKKGIAMMMEVTHDNYPIIVPTAEELKELLPTDLQPNYANITADAAAATTQNFIAGHPMSLSFQQNKGRGLAGVVTQLSFDYEDGAWRTDPGSRAPMIVSVNMSFAPMHDLTPGIDAYGRQMAPTHPVGKLNQDPHESLMSSYDPYSQVGSFEKAILNQPEPPPTAEPGGLLGALGL